MSRGTWLWLGAILAVGAILRLARLTEPPGGFHAFNEGFYVDLARRAQAAGVFDWFLRPLDVNNPPLYAGVVSTLYRFNVPEVAGARAVSALAGLLAVVATFALGRVLYNERTALTAAGLLAVMPGVVLVDHNAQVDSLFVALLMWSVALYVISRKTHSLVQTGVAGAFLGLSILTKQPAVLAFGALAVWETWRGRGVRWLSERSTWAYVVAAAATGLSWYAMRLIVDRQEFVGTVSAIAANPGMSTLDLTFWRVVLADELVWMVFPLTAAVGMVGVGYLVRQRKAGDKLVVAFLAVYLCYYVAFHFHSYYLLPLAPFFALAAARALAGIGGSRVPLSWRTGVAVALVVLMSFGSVVMLATKKWGRWSPLSLTEVLESSGPDAQLYYHPDIAGSHGTVIRLLPSEKAPKEMGSAEFAALPDASGSAAVLLASIGGPSAPAAQPRTILVDDVVEPAILGWRVSTLDENGPNRQHVFANPPWRLWYSDALPFMGLAKTRRPCGWALYDRDSFGP